VDQAERNLSQYALDYEYNTRIYEYYEGGYYELANREFCHAGPASIISGV